MAKLAWTPWLKVVKIRPDLNSGELSLNMFAHRVDDLAMDNAEPVFHNGGRLGPPSYSTFNRREPAKDDDAQRLEGNDGNAVRQVEPTDWRQMPRNHSLLMLWPLVSAPQKLPYLSAGKKFVENTAIEDGPWSKSRGRTGQFA